MLTVHHLNQSRSQRVLWALEELQLPYQIVRYQREKTMLVPAALKKSIRWANHRYWKITAMCWRSPGRSSSICRKPDSGGLLKPQGIDDKLQYRFWLHYAEGSLMPLLLMKLVFASLGKPLCPLAFARWVRCWARGYRKRGSIRSWPPMRGSLTTILPRGHGSLASG